MYLFNFKEHKLSNKNEDSEKLHLHYVESTKQVYL